MSELENLLDSNCGNNYTIETALLMAAGKGTRIRPISAEIPKPLIPINGIPIIESLIKAVQLAGIKEIIITVGYKKEKYYYLANKYDGITFIENKEFESKNTISSFYAAKDALYDRNCIISESDIYVFDPNIVKRSVDLSRYYIREVAPQNYEWGFQLENREKIKKIVRPQPNVYLDHHMYGFAYWLKDDLNQIIAEVDRTYTSPGHEDLAYDEVVNSLYGNLDVGVLRVGPGQLHEIDNLKDLVMVDPAYAEYQIR